jgi:hypothetical protein
MEANTPATPSFPGGNPIDKNSVQDNPTKVRATAEKVSALARPKGPNASAMVLGLVAILLSGLIIANETVGLQVDWSRLGPGAIVGIGLLFVVLGAIGLVRRHEDV